MKTNFFQQIAGLGFYGNFLLNIHHDETGVQTVSVVLKNDKRSFSTRRPSKKPELPPM